MKRTGLMFAAFVPFAVMAQGTDNNIRVDSEKLKRAIPATALLSEEVRTKQGEEIGDVEDIVASRDGKVRHYLVDADLSKLEGGEARHDKDKGVTEEGGEWSDERVAAETREAGADMKNAASDVEEEFNNDESWSERSQEADRAVDWMGEEFTPVKPRSVSYNEAEDELVVEVDALKANAQSVSDSPDGMRVSEIIGMEVNLADEDSFGRVEDVMMNEDGSEIVALVVDNWDGLDKKRRALPLEGANIAYDEEEIAYSYSLEQIENVSEFNLEAHGEDGWNLDEAL